MTRQLYQGETSVMLRVMLRDSAGAGKSGITSSQVIATLTTEHLEPSTLTAQAIASIGVYEAPTLTSNYRFGEVDSVRTPGLYELHFSDNAFGYVTEDRFFDLFLKNNGGSFVDYWEPIQILQHNPDDAFDQILARVNAARVVYGGPVSNTLTATIIQGDDYLNADGEALSWTIEDYTGPSVSGATALLKVMTYDDYIADGGTVALSTTATAAMVGDDLVLKADLTAAQTAALEASPPDDKWNYVYQVVVTLSNGHVITPARATGAMTVQKRVA